MKIYYYHTRPISEALQEWKEKKHPGHILYGLTHFQKNGIECVLHKYKQSDSRLKMMLYNLRQILMCKEKFDAVYGTSFWGLELLIFLRALGLYRKPIIIWHHTAIVSSSNWLRNTISNFFYKGIDLMFFFSTSLIEASLNTGKVKAEKLKLIHWGADLDFYDYILEENFSQQKSKRFISTGKENRDLITLLHAFSRTTANLEIFIADTNGITNYKAEYNTFIHGNNYPNIQVNFVSGIIPYQLAKEVAQSFAVVICCQKFSYTVGLTTLVEALALGLPIITTNNPWFEINIQQEGCGLCIEYGDTESWKNAIEYLMCNPKEAEEMGKKGRKLAERQYNLEYYTKELAIVIKDFFVRTKKGI